MGPDSIEHARWPLMVPSIHAQCAALPTGTQADYTVSPLAIAALLAWDDDENNE